MLVPWKRRASVLIGDELIVTKVQMKGEQLMILTNSEDDEWSHFSLRKYEVSFLKTLVYREQTSKVDLPEPEKPALMILYEKSGVIAMSVVLKNFKEMHMLHTSLKHDKNLNVNTIEKNSYLEDKFCGLPLSFLVPHDYFGDESVQQNINMNLIEEKSNIHREPIKMKAFNALTYDLRTRKVLISSVQGNQLFQIRRFDAEPHSLSDLFTTDNMPKSLNEFVTGYVKHIMLMYDFQTLIAIGVFYTCLIFFSVFTLPQLIIFTIALAFGIAKFDLHLARINETRIFQKKAPSQQELYAKRLVSFSRAELKEYLDERTRKIRLSETHAAEAEKTTAQ